MKSELSGERLCFLEDELADLLWNYLNLIASAPGNIEFEAVINRCINKYQSRMDWIESGQPWHEIKNQQKLALAKKLELESVVKKSEVKD